MRIALTIVITVLSFGLQAQGKILLTSDYNTEILASGNRIQVVYKRKAGFDGERFVSEKTMSKAGRLLRVDSSEMVLRKLFGKELIIKPENLISLRNAQFHPYSDIAAILVTGGVMTYGIAFTPLSYGVLPLIIPGVLILTVDYRLLHPWRMVAPNRSKRKTVWQMEIVSGG